MNSTSIFILDIRGIFYYLSACGLIEGDNCRETDQIVQSTGRYVVFTRFCT